MKGDDNLSFHSTTSTRSRTMPLRWLSHIFNCTACIYQTATRWDLPDCYSMRFTTLQNYYLIDWCDVDFRLFACWFDYRFYYSYLTWETGGLELANRLTKCASPAGLWMLVCARNPDRWEKLWSSLIFYLGHEKTCGRRMERI